MASAAGLRPNHYEVLGLSPKATPEEIAHAFANKMGMFSARSVTAAAAIGTAFEVLRDSARRRAYDRALGLIADPAPREWRMTAQVPAGTGFIGSAWGRLTEEGAAATVARPIAESDAPVRRAAPPVVAPPAAELEPLVSAAREERPIDWRRPALLVGGLILTAGLVGTLAGMSVKDWEDAAPAAGTTVAVPPATAGPKITAPAAVSAVAEPQPTIHARRSLAPVRREVAAPHPSFAEKAVAQIDDAAPASADTPPPVDVASDELAPVPEATPAAMALPKSVIARTIERIGYSCGTVVSTAPASGSGVYPVTCSSGQTYRATPVHGRYRFHRSG